MNAPINLYFDVTPANEISQMVDSDFSKYNAFKDSIHGILYPAYALAQTLVLIVYFMPHLFLPLMAMAYFILKSQASQKPIDNVI